jgi:hypothetical protein
VHTAIIAAMGVNILDNQDLEALDCVAAEECNVASPQQWHNRGMEARRGSHQLPRPQSFTARPPAGMQEDGVARRDLDAGEFLPRFNVFRIDWVDGSRYGMRFSRGMSMSTPRVTIPLIRW